MMEEVQMQEKTETLSNLFANAWKKFQAIENGDDATSSDGYQSKVKTCNEELVQCTCMVNALGLFSSNEEVDEVSTTNLKFFLLPAFLGELQLKVINEDRKTNIKNALTYFKDFLKRCQVYKIISNNISRYINDQACGNNNKKTLPAQTREEKIASYKENKNFTTKIEIMQKRLEDQPNTIDDDMVREYHLYWIKLWVNKSIENISFIYKELEMLQHMESRHGKIEHVESKNDRPLMKPILITRDMIQRQIFGAGYRNLPTMSEEEYFEKEVREGKIVLDYTPKVQSDGKDEESKSKSESEDEDDEEKLQKARAWDEWKDTHRRGEGNKERNG